MDAGELEGTANFVLHQAGEDGTEAPSLKALAATVGPVEYHRGLRGHAALARVGEQWRIYVRRGLPDVVARFAIAHEIAEFWLMVERHLGDWVEHDANYTAAAMLTPRAAFLRAIREGLDRVALADEFGITQTHAALREAELTGQPRAVVTPQRVYLRGDDQPWTEDQAKREARRPGPGVRKSVLTDAPRRVVLDVEGSSDD